VGGSVLQVIPAEAAEYVHQMVHKEKAAAPAGKYAPKYFSAPQYATLLFLCDAIIPKDEKSGGAVEAGAPEFIDLLTSENPGYQLSSRRTLLARRRLHGSLRQRFYGMHPGAEDGDHGPDRLS